ncbi:tRNA pseudouridine(38-40) synthase TruA [Haloquadratum walsbyi]|uniref:tRNA pseudouridine synthase A n=1 Tax=Haloquadratum walsbyi J07HQW2 TaxID=1238425 RepID=U1N003_9EURY|nr:tRNA pseudouridine(38-40) synthase TruA [Haloquadratum walsbyi]ERG96109.1 MAG: pseudouridylate synthase [Haloquadratum walsbyi J07HQW2]
MRAFRVAYDGRPFSGFQRQPSVPTVEDALFDALESLDVFTRKTDSKPSRYAAAGRTDAGVSAVKQTVGFKCPSWCTPRAINSELPETIRAWASADVQSGFHATHHAIQRTYTYHLYGPELDSNRLNTATRILSGKHDFHNFTPDDTGTTRELSISLEFDDPFVTARITAGGFPRSLVRRIASALRSVGSASMTIETLTELLDTVPQTGPDGIPTAPPEPLVLTMVSYPNITFQTDDRAVDDLRSVFTHHYQRHLTQARIAKHVASATVTDTDVSTDSQTE